MISETRDSFDSWVLSSYRRLHELLFDKSKRFRMEYLLSGYMLSYRLIKPWRERVRACEDVRDKIEPRMVKDIRDFLDALFSWFMAQEPQEMSDVDMAIYMPIIAYGAAERARFLKEKGRPQTLEQIKEWMESPEAAEDSVYFVMDMVDRYNEEGRELPQDLRRICGWWQDCSKLKGSWREVTRQGE